ncbi:hypothetical protein [Kineococcus indalonis]|uniref:hypothetical protein n=1 Tax=Kineococcus indalonis TaxID=2696566 RepID=UPI00196AF633|nr:hypothetical protein [Kineococcus indalonis]NAZ85194.1 hypothetical protein [Kineococcus indalonis]
MPHPPLDLSHLIPAWIERVLRDAGDAGSTVRDIREHVWAQLPVGIRTSPLSLEVGERLSNTLTAMKRNGHVVHEARTQIWRWRDFDQPRLF